MKKAPISLQIPLLWLREKLYWHYYRNYVHQYEHLFNNAPLYYTQGNYIMDLVSTDLISQHIAFTGYYENYLSKQIYELGRRGGIMIDVGANMGYFSLLFAHANQVNQVRCFEASPNVYPLLAGNIDKNDLQERVGAHQIAIGKEEGIFMFEQGPSSQTGWGKLTKEQTNSTIKVKMKTLDSLLKSVSSDILILKIDIEGADTWALYGAEKLIANRKIKNIFFEKNEPNMKKLGLRSDEAEVFLSDYGYRVLHIDSSLIKATIS